MKRTPNAGVASVIQQLRNQIAAFARSEDPEVVHQMRVALRRLRVATRLCKGALDRKREEQLRSDLKWIFAKLGQLRDLQVFDATLRERVVPGTPGSAALARSVERDIRQQRAALLALLAGERMHRLLEQLSALVATQEAQAPSRHRVVHRLRKRRRRARDALRATLQDPDQVHRARKELKKLRYGCDLGAALFRPARLRRYLKAMKQVQEQLGAMVDLSVWQRLARSHCRSAALRDSLRTQFERERTLRAAGLAAHIEQFTQASPPWR